MRDFNLPNLTLSWSERMAQKRRTARFDTLCFSGLTALLCMVVYGLPNLLNNPNQMTTMQASVLATAPSLDQDARPLDLLHWLEHLSQLTFTAEVLVAFDFHAERVAIELTMPLAQSQQHMSSLALPSWYPTQTTFQQVDQQLPLTKLEFRRGFPHE